MQEEADQQDDSDSDRGNDIEMPVLVRRQHHDDSSNDYTSDESYDYHTDNDNSSIEDSNDECNNTIPGLQERTPDNSSSDGDSVYYQDHACDHTPATTHQSVPQSINTKPIVHEWTDANIDEDEYDGDHDDDDLSTQAKRVTMVPLRLQGGKGKPVVETVIEEDIEEVTAEQEQTQPSPKQAPVPTTAKPSRPPQKPEYNPMKDEPPPVTITPLYVPLFKKKRTLG